MSALVVFVVATAMGLTACHMPPAALPPSANLKPSLAAPECPKIGGIYELVGDPMPGSMEFYRNRNSKLTLNAMLGVDAPADLPQDAVRVELLHDDTLELVNRHDGRVAAHQLDLQPEDHVVCRPNQIVIERTRFEGGNDPEPLRNISNMAQEVTVEQDGSLLVHTRISTKSKSAFFSTPVPPQEYSARFRRLD